MNVLIIMKVCFLHIQCNPQSKSHQDPFSRNQETSSKIYIANCKETRIVKAIFKNTKLDDPITLFQDLL